MKEFKKYYIIPETPDQVYLALVTETTISLWTGEEAIMKEEANTEFELFGGNIVGKNLAFEKGKQLTQQWYFGNDAEPSIVTIKLHPHKNNQTSLELKHTNIPDADYNEIVEGWNDVYMASLIEFYS
ncbi:MAG: SRPBCC domain-containing protein [Chryseotalea sp.]